MSENKAFVERLSALTDEAKQKVLDRKARLLEEGWDEERASMMSVGILPEKRIKWPPNLRYRLSVAMKATGLRRGTQEYIARHKKEEQKVRDWLDCWFWRSHERKKESKS